MCVCCAKLLQSCLTLCYPMDHSSPSASVHEILQARILQWVAMPSSRGSSRSRDQTLHLMCAALAPSLMSLVLVGRFFTTNAAWKAPTYGLKSQLRSRSLTLDMQRLSELLSVYGLRYRILSVKSQK